MNWTELFEQFSSVHEELSEQFLWTELELNCRSPSHNRTQKRELFIDFVQNEKNVTIERVNHK